MFIKLDELYIKLESIYQVGPYDLNFENGYEAGICINGEKYCLVRFTAPKDYINSEELQAVSEFTKKATQEIMKLIDENVTELKMDGVPIVEKLREMLGEFKQNHDDTAIEG